MDVLKQKLFNPQIRYNITSKTCILGNMQFTDWSVQARTVYGIQLRFEQHTIIAWTINLHIALKVMFSLLLVCCTFYSIICILCCLICLVCAVVMGNSSLSDSHTWMSNSQKYIRNRSLTNLNKQKSENMNIDIITKLTQTS